MTSDGFQTPNFPIGGPANNLGNPQFPNLPAIAAVTIMSVAQRWSELGLRRAVGYGRLEIARLIVLEAAGLGLLGGILGASIGVLAICAIASGNHWTPVMNTTPVVVAPFLGVAGRRARRLPPGDPRRPDHADGGAALLRIFHRTQVDEGGRGRW